MTLYVHRAMLVSAYTAEPVTLGAMLRERAGSRRRAVVHAGASNKTAEGYGMLNCTIVEGGVHCKLADDVAALQWTVKLLAVHALSTIARCHDEVAEVCRRVASVDRALREVDHGR